MNRTTLLIIFAIFASIGAYAMPQEEINNPNDTLENVRQDSLLLCQDSLPQYKDSLLQYMDSLRIYKAKLDAAVAGNDSLRQALDIRTKAQGAEYDLLSPLTYYRDVARRSLSLDEGEKDRQFTDDAMMQMYLNHPELVSETEDNLNTHGNIAFKPKEPVRQGINFTSQAEEMEIKPKSAQDEQMQIDLVATKPNFWTFAGDYSLQFLQNYVSDNWYKGGESNYSMIGAATLQANYNDKEKVKWDNKLEMKLGMQSSQGDEVHKFKSSEDLIRLTTKLGIQATKKWYYTIQGIVSTQFTHGYKSNDEKVYSDFMSPLTANLSLGMDYKLSWFKNHLTGTVNISPLAGNLKYVDRLGLATRNGIDEGKHSKLDYGSTFTADLTWKFSDLVKWQTRLYGFTSYHRAEVEWENTITFQLSKYISTKVFIYPRFDDSASTYDKDYGYFQLKEYWSLGFNYSF